MAAGEALSLKNKDNKMIKELVTIAGHLDRRGLLKESDYLDALIRVASDCGSKADDNVSDEQNEKFNMDGDDKAFEPEDFKMLREKNENSADDTDRAAATPSFKGHIDYIKALRQSGLPPAIIRYFEKATLANGEAVDASYRTVECPKCTTMNYPSANHCENCGHKLK